ncbi:stigma-specific STIG1-like protein 1 [Macadamia integrifolia]|uniref:stigma-specific STIG1-like protein 1 n=1 Tax=Macadamia integrifolia TaxID=60698 RepID=UPI001C52A368|nr:stigma-specific STIG1-like protein 1 [Macadamia integrifolia]
MKLMNVFLVLAVAMALIIGVATATMPSKEEEDDAMELSLELDQDMVVDPFNHSLPEREQPSSSSTSLRGASQFLRHKSSSPRQRMTCNRYPRICRAKGSPGPDCCKKKCVNVSTDRLNCGICGKKCKYNEICCRGKCVNPSFDKKNCGRCNNRCEKGRSCVLGICNYA